MESGHAQWRKSSFSTEGADCIEIAYLAEPRVGVRDSKNPEGGHLTLPETALRSLTRTLG